MNSFLVYSVSHTLTYLWWIHLSTLSTDASVNVCMQATTANFIRYLASSRPLQDCTWSWNTHIVKTWITPLDWLWDFFDFWSDECSTIVPANECAFHSQPSSISVWKGVLCNKVIWTSTKFEPHLKQLATYQPSWTLNEERKRSQLNMQLTNCTFYILLLSVRQNFRS